MPAKNFPIEPTAYQVLGVDADATAEQLRKAYRKAARTRHPDVGGSAEDFDLLVQAWDLVKDPAHRADYDARLKATHRTGSPTTTAGPTQQTTTPPARGQSASATTAGTPRKQPAAVQVRPPLVDGPITVENKKHQVVVDATITQKLSHGVLRGRKGQLHQQAMEQLLPRVRQAIPAARVVHNFRYKKSRLSSVVMPTLMFAGDRIAVVEVVVTPADSYRWTGTELVGAKTIRVPDLTSNIGLIQELFPRTTVEGFVVLLADGNPHAPTVNADLTVPNTLGLHDPPAHIIGAARDLKLFFGTSDQHHVLDRHLLGQLLLGVRQ